MKYLAIPAMLLLFSCAEPKKEYIALNVLCDWRNAMVDKWEQAVADGTATAEGIAKVTPSIAESADCEDPAKVQEYMNDPDQTRDNELSAAAIKTHGLIFAYLPR